MLDNARWKILLETFGRAEKWQDQYAALIAAYGERHRHYHNADHIDHCLGEFDAVSHLAEHANEVEFSIWLHDVVYKPQSRNNEKKSAQWALGVLAAIGCGEPVAGRVCKLIMATRHHKPSEDNDTRLLLDIDLSILGQPPEGFDIYENAVRKEYKWVPRKAYSIGRRKVLKAFLDMPHIFQTPWFRDKYEKRARQNLLAAIARL